MPQLEGDEILFVNFTPTAIYDPAICLRTTWAIARRHGFPMERICFEVVETEQFPDLTFLRSILDEYRAQGAMVALDDLGAGHSSLTYLDALRPDVVKLDRELVSGIDSDPARQRLLAALVHYAHELDVQVVAEGIETEAELSVVCDLGADLGQGWYLGRPAAEPVRVERRLVLDAKAGHTHGTTMELRDRALACATSGVVISDARQEGLPIIYANPAFERLTGYSLAEITGRSCKFVQGEGTEPAASVEMGAAIREGRECRMTVLNYRKDHTAYWCEIHLSPVLDKAGRVLQYVGVQNDVTDRVEAEQELRRQHDRFQGLAYRDALTELPNRRAFMTAADTLLQGLTGDQSDAVLFIELNHFKRVNDVHGHEIGDEVLCRVATEFRRLLGPDALLARLAGDEFLAFFVEPDATTANVRASDTAALATASLYEHPIAGPISASVGWALAAAGHQRPLCDLINDADTMMYQRKGHENRRATDAAPFVVMHSR